MPMDYLLGRMLRSVNYFLESYEWLPTERCQLSFYSQKLVALSKEFQRRIITYDEDYLWELFDDMTLDILFSEIGGSKSGTSFDHSDLNRVGDRLAFQVALIFKASRQDFSKESSSQFFFEDDKFQKQKASTSIDRRMISIFLSSRAHRRGKDSEYHNSFSNLVEEMERLLTYPNWLPIEKCQISFYSQMLRFVAFNKSTNLSTLSHDPIDLSNLVSRILEYKNVRTSVDFMNFHDPPHLTDVGDQLAIQVEKIYKDYRPVSGKAQELVAQYFVSQFYFEKNIFEEFLFDKQPKGEVFIGFQAEVEDLLKKLACITKKQLEVISIVGMAGLGKTTLATRLYNDPYVVSHFYVRAWVTCSQVYKKRDLLLAILRSVIEVTDEVCMVDDSILAHDLYHALEGQRFLIVIDDVWSSEAWDDFKRSFPDDNNGSKIMLTTRLKDVALHAQSNRNPFCLRLRTEEESFDLFRMKTFTSGRDFDDLSLIGKNITRKCRGLPLSIVVIAGLLKNNFNIDWWVQVAESVSSYIATDENQYMDTLALSYNHLPQHLRPCFLSFGAFPEDHEIPVRKLIWLWIAEGFIHQDGTKKSLETIAEEYLMDLIGRSLVVGGKKGGNGAIKTCCIHDLLRDLCLTKAKEENFSPNVYQYNKHILISQFREASSLTNLSTKSQLFLSTDVLNIPANCVCSSSEVPRSILKDVSIIWDTSKLIKALDISSVELFEFPSALVELVELRYLELRFRSGNPPESISQLGELQTLIMSSRTNMVVPGNMWMMINLRHICIKSGENLVNLSNVEEPSLLENLQTLSLVSPTRPCQNILARTPNLQKLGLCGPFTTRSGDLKFPDLSHLNHLESLKLLNTIPLCKPGRLSDSIMFPESLKSLSLSNTYLDWNESWALELIPNLEVLKLKFHAFVGKQWESSPEAFRRLKFLKLDELDIVTWTASRGDFPVLQRLQVYRCPYLKEIPEDFGNIFTLKWIELSGCNEAAANSARDIQQEQKGYGNDWPKILLIPGLTPS